MTKIEMNSLAAKKIREALAEQNNPELKCRVAIDHVHGDHAHYGLTFDTQNRRTKWSRPKACNCSSARTTRISLTAW